MFEKTAADIHARTYTDYDKVSKCRFDSTFEEDPKSKAWHEIKAVYRVLQAISQLFKGYRVKWFSL
jgi:hypothetical protein